MRGQNRLKDQDLQKLKIMKCMFEIMREPLWSSRGSRLIASLPADSKGDQLASLVSRSKLSLLYVSRIISVN
jgi:hypothetical protein